MYVLVEEYGGPPLRVAPDLTLSTSSCLLEGDDVIRVMVNAGLEVAAEHWHEAHVSGAAAIYVVTDDGVGLVTAETFMDRRVENRATMTYQIPPEAVRPLAGWPESYLHAVGLLGDHPPLTPAPSLSRFVHLHAHSEMSALDGYSTVQEMVDLAVGDGQPALAVTDHGVCSGHPDLAMRAAAAGIKPLFGMEANFVDDRTKKAPPKLDLTGVAPSEVDAFRAAHKEAQRDARDYYHLILWAMNDEGLRNLWAISTVGYVDGLYYRPRVDWDVLERHSAGVMASTACLRGPVAHPLLRDDHETAEQNLGRLLGIFGDRLYAEIHTNALEDQRTANQAILALAERHGIPPIAVVDSHYPCREDQHAHKVWLASQLNKDLSDDEALFAGDHEYHLMSGKEVVSALDYLPEATVAEAMANTVAVADRCDASLGSKSSMPIFTRPGNYASRQERLDADVEMLVRLALGTPEDGYANWQAKCVGPTKTHPPEVYMARFEREMSLLVSKGFVGYFLMVAAQVSWAKREGCLVGPGRGSGAGSLVAYLLGITTPDPVESDLLFERFLTEDRDDPPDFDIDYPSTWRERIQDHEMERWGEDHIVRVGTNLRLKSKGVFQSLARVYGDEVDFRDFAQVANIIDRAEAGSAGLGLSWDELWSQHGEELEPYRTKYPTLFDLAERMRGRLKSYGRHPAGLVISPDEPLRDRLPMRASDKSSQLISQFDMDALGDMGFIKFDILTLRNLDTLQGCLDLIRERHGTAPDVYEWESEYEDPQVWDLICDGHTLGIFQIETSSGTKLIRQFQPRSIAELADVITIVRPGPERSGLTASYLRRRAGFEDVTVFDERLRDVLDPTQGVIIYQEQVMTACQVVAGYSLAEANNIRKILGKKKVELVESAGREFVDRAVGMDMDRKAAEHLWEQLGEFSRYCVSGDTEVHLASSGASSDGTVRVDDLYRRINAPLLPPTTRATPPYAGPCVVCGATESKAWTRGACQPCYVWRKKFRDVTRGVRGLVVEADDRIRPGRILAVHKLDPEQTYTVTLADGRSITATANHRHLTSEGLRRVDELSVGDALMVDAGYEQHVYGPSEYRTTKGERRAEGHVAGAFGEDNHGFVDGGFAQLMAWTAQAPGACEECGHDGTEHRLERAHLDGDRSNNDWSNLRMLCVSCHKRHDYAFNGRRRRWGKGHPIAPMEIVSIEPRAVEPVYSVVMDDPHIWIANGIATENSFNRSHAWCYALIGFWTAWFKTHYPIEFLVATLSTVAKDRIPEFVNEARRMGYKVQAPDINESGIGFTATDLSCRYGFDAIDGIGKAAAKAIISGQPYVSVDDFIERSGKEANRRVLKLLARVGAFDAFEPNRRALVERLEWEDSDESGVCVYKTSAVDPAIGLPCTFDWKSEPVVIGRSGRPLKAKPLPKRCTKACRQFTPPEVPDFSKIEDYSDAAVREVERELLGTYLSSTPFDVFSDEDREQLTLGSDLAIGPVGHYQIAATVSRVKAHQDRNGNAMAFLGLYAQDQEVDVVAFSSMWEQVKGTFAPGALVLAEVSKNGRGLSLVDLIVITPGRI